MAFKCLKFQTSLCPALMFPVNHTNGGIERADAASKPWIQHVTHGGYGEVSWTEHGPPGGADGQTTTITRQSCITCRCYAMQALHHLVILRQLSHTTS
ncbi:hypothetical protein ElyMa_004591100 [Elysia marginata]|uniref:Secreted protein n=1 Tax=Elysia marginata TaxID=1093978 RepID=A0AAV4HUG2_9GAST|nr:hypothetical protein ElyMa_004591100 [Elysia marginata]